MTAVPPGWPADLPAVGAGFDEAVVGWLLDRLPPEFRTSQMRKHPVILAEAAVHHSRATLDGVRDTYRGLRAATRDLLPQEQIDSGLVALEALAAQFSKVEREVELVRAALRGASWRPRL